MASSVLLPGQLQSLCQRAERPALLQRAQSHASFAPGQHLHEWHASWPSAPVGSVT